MLKVSKKLFSVLLSILLAVGVVGFSACVKPDEPIDNTEASLNHDPIYYYTEDNVPYEHGDCRNYCFLTPYLAAKPSGGAVVLFPGGGYNHLSNDSTKGGADNNGDQKEASAVAAWLNASGISLFIVNYRTTAVDSALDYHGIMSDATRAMKYVRAHAEENYVDVNKIAAMGYSAGGHLASMMLVCADFEIDDVSYVKDEIDLLSAKANAGVLSYAVLTFVESGAHAATRKNFTGANSSLYSTFSPELHVDANTPPCFVWCEENDATVPSSNTYGFCSALDAVGVVNEMHVFADVGASLHGIGVAQDFEEARVWPTLATTFLKNLNF